MSKTLPNNSPDILSKKKTKNTPRPAALGQTGLYLHVPFCASICSYCDFYSAVGSKKEREDYVKALLRGIQTTPYPKLFLDTIYFGGGTPSLLTPEQIDRILTAVSDTWTVSPTTEITLEANPETVTDASLRGYKKAGVNRVSFGVQSSQQKELEALARRHTAEKAKESILLAAEYFPHLSGDLMLGIPFQTLETLEESIDFLATLPLDHISAYMLGLEPTVPLYDSPLMEQAAGEEELSTMYLHMVERVAGHGFAQYEISNFAKPGGKSRHNTKYWTGEPYLGIGPSAHSFVEGKRFAFPSDREEFIKAERPFHLVQQQGEGGDVEEFIMLNLRLTQGLSLKKLALKYPDFDPSLLWQRGRELEKQGLVLVLPDRLCLTTKGFLFSNHVIATLLFG